jgi:repressor LexA
MKGLTDKQKEMLRYIERFQSREGMAPTVYEIAANFRIKTSTVFTHLKSLEKKGFLIRSSKARSITLTNRPRAKTKGPAFCPVPIFSKISAGLNIESDKNREGEILVDNAVCEAVGRKNIFALRMSGNSLRDFGILDGDALIMKLTRRARANDIALVSVGRKSALAAFIPSEKGKKVQLKGTEPPLSKVYTGGEVSVTAALISLQRNYF